jgi:hypothetical protein
MARQGHGLAYAVDTESARPEVLEAQAEAQKARRGMWKKGVVWGVVSSVHSYGEDGKNEPAYNRVVDTRTGRASKRAHTEAYQTCQKVCETVDETTSCMVYVPFQNRYRNKPECLRKPKSKRR